MKCIRGRFWLLWLLVTMLCGCAGLGERGPIIQTEPEVIDFEAAQLPEAQYQSKVDHVQVLFDTSASMAVDGDQNLQSAKNFVSTMLTSLPAGYSTDIGLRIFGDDQAGGTNRTVLLQPMGRLESGGVNDGLAQIQSASGESPLHAAVTAAVDDMQGLDGKSALVIVSDGSWSWRDLPDETMALLDEQGDAICVHTVWIGDIEGTQRVLSRVVDAASCGSASEGADLAEQGAMAEFIENVFLASSGAQQSDPVEASPVAEPQTETPLVFTLLFEFNKDQVTDEMLPILGLAKQTMARDLSLTCEVSGHADSWGTETYNQALSERRAGSVTKWLVDSGVDAGRLSPVGYGESQPRADNTFAEGRRLNRRVVICPE